VTPPSPTEVVIEICGEGKTDVAKMDDAPVPPAAGVVTALTHRLCDAPSALRVKRTPLMFLQQGKPLWQKVWLFKRTAKINGSAGCVFVMDSEGKPRDVRAELEHGRDHMHPDFPMAVGVAHPCVEAWLLSDASAVKRGFNLSGPRPTVPPNPESLPAPQANRANNPKTALAACHPNNRHPNLAEKSLMAEHLDLATAATTCPSFAAFAAEVRQHIRPLFPSSSQAGTVLADPGDDDDSDESPAAPG
jgi:hypothetical protein